MPHNATEAAVRRLDFNVDEISVVLRFPSGQSYRFSTYPEDDLYCKAWADFVGEHLPETVLREAARLAVIAEHSRGKCLFDDGGPL